MSEWYGEEQLGEEEPTLTPLRPGSLLSPTHIYKETIKPRILSFEEASRCLNTLGKDESGVRYAYLMLTATEKRLTDVAVIVNFKHLLYLDLSGNILNLSSLQVVCDVPFLLYLKAERNIIESAALKPAPYLQVLILNKNQISETGNIAQQMLENLELGDNSLYTLQFDQEKTTYLKELSLHGNYLIDTAGMFPIHLEKLYLNRNKIMKITQHLCDLKYLQILHLRDNFIRKLNGFTKSLENLTYLNLRSNKIEKMREFRKLQCLPKLETLIILDNPIYKLSVKENIEEEEVEEEEGENDNVSDYNNEEKRIRLAILVLLPNLKRINKIKVTNREIEEAAENGRRIIKQIYEEESSEEEAEVTLTTTDFTTEYTTETSVEMKGTPIDSSFKLEQFVSPEEGEGYTNKKLERKVDINLIPEVDGE